ncbi:neuronal membrane glycoprotein M6-b-like isoform X3 [Ostrea edulis]|uniref:neuronal membrane glycoprotein M6-b-like isoform X3 n=1 Tax=Ostrea edulis TaxID=37623 RepID=UPI0020953043|nr:neuronal membrane glycoprotein M6-b-like isoform X3 [Ostrea edulis]XP_056012385.1 neuronal membrane glycoprotein M6-b-like isoform X3 [Ostrea edulis]
MDITEERKERNGVSTKANKQNDINRKARSEKCSDRFLHCLSQVPCGSLIAWIILLVGLGGLTGGLLIGAQKTRDMLDNDQFLWFIEYTLIGVVVSMFVIGTLLLFVGHISTEPTSRHVFQTTNKNMCAQGLNIFLMVFCYILGFLWIVASVVLAVPVYLLSLLYIVDFTSIQPGASDGKIHKCINLVNYGLENQEFCGTDFQNFEREGKQLIISYIAALLSSILIAISLIHFLIVISANLTHLRNSRVATLNAYDDDLANSKLVADTTM